MHVLVVAKEPRPGKVKTRLMPALTPEQAAAVAQAALEDTLSAVAASTASRRVIALDGEAGDWIPPGFTVIPQRGADFGGRLAAAWHDAGAPGLQIGMDTPQVSPHLLNEGMAMLEGNDTDAVLGLAEDGGWWAIGFNRPTPHAFIGVPMSTPDTGERQLAQLRRLGLRVQLLPVLRDIDTSDDLDAVCAAYPHLRVAGALLP